MKNIDFIMRILVKVVISFLVILGIYWGNYLWKYEISESIKQHRKLKYYETHEYPKTTRGGYAQPSHDSIPNTLRPDTLR